MAWKVRRDPSGASSEVPFPVQGKVGRIEDPPPAVFFKRYVQANRPVVVSGAMEEWPALGRWSWDYLAAVAGDCSGEVIVSRNGLYPDHITQPSPMAKVEMRFAEFLRRAVPAAPSGSAEPLPPILGPGETYYLYGKSYLLDAVPSLRADLRTPACLGSAGGVGGIGGMAQPFQRLWISSTGCVTPLHYDLSNGFLCQVRGSKQVWLFDPAQLDRLYPRGAQFPGLDNFERQSQVDIHHPDYEAFPELRRAAALECHLRQGDTLFIPSNWWHEVETLEPSLSVQLAFAGGTVTSELAMLSDLFKTRKPEELMTEPAVQRLLQDPTMMQAVLRMMAAPRG